MATAGGIASARIAVKSQLGHGHGRQASGADHHHQFDKSQHVDKYYSHLCRLEKKLDDDAPEMSTGEHMLQIFFAVAVCFSVAVVAAEVEFGPGDDASWEEKRLWLFLEIVLTIIFTIEIILGLVIEKCRWCASGWHWFDVGLVGVSVTQITSALMDSGVGDFMLIKLLRALRLMRLIRVVKLVRSCKSIYIVFMAWWAALHSVFQVYGMMMGGLFFYATVATATMGKNPELKDISLGDRTVEETFGTIFTSMYSLFQLMTLEGFDQTTRPIVMMQPLSFVFFASYVMVFSFGLLNMLVGLVVSRTIGETQRLEHEASMATLYQEMETMRKIFEACDAISDKQTGEISLEDFESAIKGNDQVLPWLEQVGLPSIDAVDLFNIVDVSFKGKVNCQEFIVGCCKIFADAEQLPTLATQASVKHLRKELKVFIDAQSGVTADERAFLYLPRKGSGDSSAESNSSETAKSKGLTRQATRGPVANGTMITDVTDEEPTPEPTPFRPTPLPSIHIGSPSAHGAEKQVKPDAWINPYEESTDTEFGRQRVVDKVAAAYESMLKESIVAFEHVVHDSLREFAQTDMRTTIRQAVAEAIEPLLKAPPMLLPRSNWSDQFHGDVKVPAAVPKPSGELWSLESEYMRTLRPAALNGVSCRMDSRGSSPPQQLNESRADSRADSRGRPPQQLNESRADSRADSRGSLLNSSLIHVDRSTEWMLNR